MDRRCIPFKIEHARYIIEQEHKRDQEEWIEKPEFEQWAEAWKDHLWAYTVTVDGIPVACAGVALQEWHKAEAWAIFSSDFKAHKLFIYRFIKAGITESFREHKLVRLQSTIDPQFPENIKWIETLGFEYEGRLRNYGPQGQDYLMYSRIK